MPREMGFELIPGDELRRLSPAEYGALVRERVGDAPRVSSRSTSTCRPGVRARHRHARSGRALPPEALGFLRALAGIDFRGFDVVEVSPPYDSAGQVTALLAANVAYEFLALRAIAARGAQQA